MMWIARRLVLPLLTLLALTQSPGRVYADNPEGREIQEVNVQGNVLHPQQEIFSKMSTRKGKAFQKKVIQEDVNRLAETGWFISGGIEVDTVDMQDGKVIVYVRVKELENVVEEIVYLGADHLSRDELDKMTKLKRGERMSPSKNQAARLEILRHYKEKFRYWATVKILEGTRQTDRRVVFDVAEGPIVRIKNIRIEFLGPHESGISEGRLKFTITSSSTLLGVMFGTFAEQMVEMDVQKLKEYYHTLGYLGARVERELIFSEDLRSVDVVFHIEEGPHYRIELFDIQPNKTTRDPEQLKVWTDARPGEYYNGMTVQNDIKRIEKVIGVTGVRASVKEDRIDMGDGKIHLVYRVEEREQARVGDIKIVGNLVTKQNVILRQLGLYPGQLLSYPELVEAERRLSKLGIFEEDQATGSKPTIEVEHADDESPFKNVLVTVKEKPTGSFMIGAGINSNSGLTGNIVVNERNFDIWRIPTSWDDIWQGRAWRGAGQELQIQAMPGTVMQRYSVTFTEPYLFDSIYTLNASGYFYNRIYNEYDETRLGGRLTLGRRITPNLSVNLTTRVEEVTISNTVAGEPPQITDYLGHALVVGVRPSVKYDTRDNYLRPSAGFVADAGVEAVTGTYSYQLATTSASKYITTYERIDGSGKHVLALRSQTSWASDNTPVFDRFWAGGFQSLRGFSFRGVSPAVDGYYIGGNFMFLNSLEYQIPVMANDHLFVVGFVDSGTVERSVEIKDYRVTVGMGLRIAVPQLLGPVPLALDFGYPLNQAPSDHRQLFSFWLGFFN
jgi:outer membrane protein assembly complex protein YaeT